VSLDDTPKIDMNFGDTGTSKSGSGFGLGSIGGWAAGWGSSTSASKKESWGGLDDGAKDADAGNPWDSSDKTKKDSNGFDFDFDAFKSPTEAASALIDKPVEDDGWATGITAPKSKKKGKKGVLIEESVPEPVAEVVSLPEPEKPAEADPFDFSFGGTKEKKKKKKGAVEEIPPPPPPEPEPPAEPEPEPVKEEDPWGSTSIKKKKGKKGKDEPKVEEPPPPPAEPEPEPEPEPAPPEPEPEPVKEVPAVDPFAGLSKSQKKKLEKKMRPRPSAFV
jgi:hypothetical protein